MTTTDLPDALDVPGWRAAIHAAPDRAGRQAVVRSWASALGCVQADDMAHVLQAPSGLPPAVAGALAYHATSTCLHLRPPSGGWPRCDALPEWLPGR